MGVAEDLSWQSLHLFRCRVGSADLGDMLKHMPALQASSTPTPFEGWLNGVEKSVSLKNRTGNNGDGVLSSGFQYTTDVRLKVFKLSSLN